MLYRACLALILATFASPARADVLRSTLNQPLSEISHTVDISIANGIATYKVRRVFANAGLVADEAGLAIDLPYGAAATGLRIRARRRWYDAELMEREQAAQRYHELTGLGAFAPKDPALLQWLWSDQLYLQVFPVLPGATSTVEYTLTVPTRYERGRILLSYPRGGPRPGATDSENGEGAELPLAAPVVSVHPSWGDATTRLLIDGQRAAPDTPLVLPAAAPVSPWALEEDDGASYIASSIEVESSARTTSAIGEVRLKLDIEHTYQSDLRVELLTPEGERLSIFDAQTAHGGQNDLRGEFKVDLPKGSQAAGTWRLIVSDHAGLDAGTLAQWSLKFGQGAQALQLTSIDTPLFIPDAPESESDLGLATLELSAAPIQVLSARLGKVVAAPSKAFSRLEIDVAAELMPLPIQAQLVFVVDASHSQGAEGIAQQLALISAYLSHVPDAQVELVLFRRHAQSVFGSFVAAQTLAERIEQARAQGLLEPGNGSHLELGARLAAELLSKRRGPLRLVVTTDALLRPSFRTEQALAALATLPARAVLHVVTPQLSDDDWASLSRMDDHALQPLAAAHHGIVALVEGSRDGESKALKREVLGLVRPTRIDDFQVRGLEDAQAGTDGVLHEGYGIRLMSPSARAPNTLTILGKIWGDPFRRELTADPRFSRATAGWVFSEDEHEDLSQPEMMRVARAGHAVSPVTSYLAIEPGVRPSTIGLEEIDHGSGSGYGRGAGGFYGRDVKQPAVRPDLMALVADAADRCFATHKSATGGALTLGVDTTYTEIVDVTRTTRGALPECLEEALWVTRLGNDFTLERDHFELTFAPR